jgi:hypothetical protein
VVLFTALQNQISSAACEWDRTEAFKGRRWWDCHETHIHILWVVPVMHTTHFHAHTHLRTCQHERGVLRHTSLVYLQPKLKIHEFPKSVHNVFLSGASAAVAWGRRAYQCWILLYTHADIQKAWWHINNYQLWSVDVLIWYVISIDKGRPLWNWQNAY